MIYEKKILETGVEMMRFALAYFVQLFDFQPLIIPIIVGR